MKAKIGFIFIVLFSFNFAWAEYPAFHDTDPDDVDSNELAAAPTPPIVLSQYTSEFGLKNLDKESQARVASCNKAVPRAKTFCISSLSPEIQTGIAVVGGVLAGIKVSDSANESCQKVNKAMDLANKAITAYNAVCGGAKFLCDSSCGGALAKIKADEKALNGELSAENVRLLNSQQGLAQCLASVGMLTTLVGCHKIWDPKIATSTTQIAALKKDIASATAATPPTETNVATCGKYKLQLAAAGLGLISLVKSAGQSKNCETATSAKPPEAVDCRLKPTDPSCAAKPLDCSIAANRTTVECICRANPAAVGCATVGNRNNGPGSNVGSNSVSTSPGRENNLGTPDFTTNDGGGDGLGTERDTPKSAADSSSAAGGLGAFGDSGGGGGFGMSGTGGKAKADGAGKKPLNPNILQGYDGGGGGGGSGRGYSGSDDSDSQLKRYLPGGANDPRRGLAGAQADGMTAAGGLTNWQKVKNRYNDNSTSLLGGGL